jgi:uncharacterized protein (DUF433 family)
LNKRMLDYIEQGNGGLYVTGTRISLDSVVYAFNGGAAPESILRSFPHLGSLLNVYGAITYYLENKVAVDEYLSARERQYEELRSRQDLPEGLKDRIEAARASLHPTNR